MIDETTPLYLESAIAARLGFTRKDLKIVRRQLLRRDYDWCLRLSRIVITAPALASVLDYLMEKTPDMPRLQGVADFADCLLEPATDKNKKNGLVQLTVSRLMRNPRLLLALTPPPAQKAVTVRVRQNINFRPHMTLQARLTSNGMYEIIGHCPRFPGRH